MRKGTDASQIYLSIHLNWIIFANEMYENSSIDFLRSNSRDIMYAKSL